MTNKLDKSLADKLQSARVKYSENVMLSGEINNNIRLLKVELDKIYLNLDKAEESISVILKDITNKHGEVEIDFTNMTYK